VNIVIITGERAAGKTTFLRHYLRQGSFASTSVVGFYAVNSGRGYKIVHVKDSRFAQLCVRDDAAAGTLKINDFYFDEKVIMLGEQWLREGFQMDDPVFIVDEVGRFELDGRVWNNVLVDILHHGKGSLVLVVRKKFLNEVIKHYGMDNVRHQLKILEV